MVGAVDRRTDAREIGGGNAAPGAGNTLRTVLNKVRVRWRSGREAGPSPAKGVEQTIQISGDWAGGALSECAKEQRARNGRAGAETRP